MTDLTAAQLVERLKDTTAESWRWELAAADLIEQQAEQIAGLTTDLRVMKQARDDWANEASKAESEVAALRRDNDKLGFDLREVWRTNMALRKVIEDAYNADNYPKAMSYLAEIVLSKALPEKETP